MNDHDKSNLEYMLSLDGNQFVKWANTLSEDDIDYAIELMRSARTNIILQTLEVYDQVDDVSDASELLKNIMKE